MVTLPFSNDIFVLQPPIATILLRVLYLPKFPSILELETYHEIEESISLNDMYAIMKHIL